MYLNKYQEEINNILFWVPGGMPLMLQIEGAIALSLSKRGIKVHAVICDGPFRACILREHKDLIPINQWQNSCRECKKHTSAVLDSLKIPYSFIGDFISKAESNNIWNKCESITIDSLADLSYGKVKIGKHAISAIRRYLKGNPLSGNEEIVREYGFTSLIVSASFERALKDISPNKIFMSHGIYSEWGPALQMAFFFGIPVITWAGSYFNAHFYFKYIENSDNVDIHTTSPIEWEKKKNLPLTNQENTYLNKFLHDRYKKNITYDLKYCNKYKEEDNYIKNKYNFNNNKPTWGVMTHVNWDGVGDCSPMVYNTFDDWIINTIKEIVNIKDVNWLIKIHPAEAWENPDTGIENLIKKVFPSLPEHIKIISSKEEINSMNFFEFVNGGVTVYGTPGLELALMGKPVILAGEAHYGSRGFTYDGLTKEEYVKLLRKAKDLPKLSEEQKELARKYAYCYFIQRQIPFPVVEGENDNWWDLQYDKLHLLLPGKDPFTDFICDRIIDGKDFIMDENLVNISEKRKEEREIKKLEKELNIFHQLIAEGNITNAIQKINNLIEKYPGSPDIINKKAELEFQIGNIDEAKNILLNIVEQYHDHSKILNNLGVIYYSKGDIEKALTFFTKALKVNPDDKVTILNIGDILLSLKKYNEANRLYLSYLEKNHGDEEIINSVNNIKRLLNKINYKIEYKNLNEDELKKLQLIGYDYKGTVYNLGQYILRLIYPEHFENAIKIYNIVKNHQLENLGIVKTELEESEKAFKHEKHIITYPFEWTANMIKDAAMFHLRLFSELDRYDLTLIDALPNNILFNFTSPVFIDFLSLLQTENLKNENWLTEGTNYPDVRSSVIEKMFIPNILIPLIALAKQKFSLARKLLSEKACNTGGGSPQLNDIYPGLPALAGHSIETVINTILQHIVNDYEIKKSIQFNQFKYCMDSVSGFIDFNKKIYDLIMDIDITPNRSNYVSYYEDKKENFSFTDQSKWENKQLSVYKVLKETKPASVLDIGANTGWFSMLAEHLGAKVIATDIDESSIDTLYLHAKNNNLKILPLSMSFDDFSKQIFGSIYSDSIYEDRDFENKPLFLPAIFRLQSDVVLCLGLLHHLILGMGKELSEVFSVLSNLTLNTLVLEFISFYDNLIQGEPSFFPNLHKHSENTYNINTIINEGLKYFDNIEILASHPNSRKLLIFKKDKSDSVKNKKKLNSIKNEEEYKNREIILTSCPTIYAIGITNICNLRCPLCITGLRKQEKPLKFIEFELFKEIIDKIKDYAELVQLYKWGESLLHKDFNRMLEYCDKYDLNTEVSSNLSLDNVNDKLEGMVKYKLKRLIVSFDGVNQEDYERYRIGGKLKIVLDNIKKIKKFKEKYNSPYPRISLQFLRNKYTKNQIEILEKNYKKWGADDYYVDNMTTIFKDRDLQKAKEWFTEEEIKKRKYLDIDVSMHGQVCSQLYRTMIIEQDGSIPSCCFATSPNDDYSKWDNKKTIQDMYNSKRFTEARKIFKKLETNKESTCNNCCILLTYKENISAKTPGISCVEEKKSLPLNLQSNTPLEVPHISISPYISVIIPTYNRANMLGITIESFVNQNYPADKFEIIISDNNSKDNTKEVVSKWIEKSPVKIKYLFEKRQGVHYARNTAALESEGEILYYTDDDMIADKNLLSEITKVFINDKTVGSATGKVLPKWEITPPDWILKLCNNYLLSLNDLGDEVKITEHDPGVFSCHQAMRREIFFKSGGFNPENTAGEWIGDGETGLNQKIKELGYKFAYVGTSIIYHMIPPFRMTQEYLNKRIANQGNCDSYSDYKKNHPDKETMINGIVKYGENLLGHLNSYINNKIQNNIQWRLHRAYIEYFKNRIDYDFRLMEDEDFRSLVLKDNWIEKTDYIKETSMDEKNTEKDIHEELNRPLTIQECELLAEKFYFSLNFSKGHNYVSKMCELKYGNIPNITEKIFQERALILCNIGKKMLENQDYKTAIQIFNEAMYSYPQINGLQYARGICLLKLGHKEEAIGAIKAELKNNPEHKEAKILYSQMILKGEKKMNDTNIKCNTDILDKLYLENYNNQAIQKQLFMHYQMLKNNKFQLPKFQDTGYRCYSQTDEDGILLYIFSLIGFTNKLLVDIAFANPYGASTTNLICNWGFSGLLIEGDRGGIEISKNFFSNHPDTFIFPPKIEQHWVTAENVNSILQNNNITGEIDLFALDVDGVDYWIWKNLNIINPRVIIVEVAAYLGKKMSITVPYDPKFNRFDIHPDYMGASIQAFRKLGKQKGYRMVACNRFGFNIIFLRNDIEIELLPEISIDECFHFETPELKQKREERLRTVLKYKWLEV